jgi:hypothetical protein
MRPGPIRGGAAVTLQTVRLGLVAGRDTQSAELLEKLIDVAVRRLTAQYTDGEFVFTTTGEATPSGGWRLRGSGRSLRYAAIAALGLRHLSDADQRAVLAGNSADDLIGQLAKRLDDCTSVGDVALVCWAAADAGHSELPHAVARLAQLDQQPGQIDVVSAAWVVSALVAARGNVDVEEQLGAARRRLLAARGAAAYPHTTRPGTPWYRAHVGSFADQVYPIQALARLHASSADPDALAVANAVARVICGAQGAGGQWWWHYDSRTGGVVEGYPVYTVHQHAMAPMALLDLADAHGDAYLDEVCQGLRWLRRPPEASVGLVLDEPPITWRKVARADYRKLVRGVRAATTRVHPGARIQALDRVYPPGTVDHECRPYELGWLLMTWLS